MIEGTITLLRSQAILAISCLLMLGGCASNEMYRSGTQGCVFTYPGDCADQALQVHRVGQSEEYRLGFIEYDDQGQLRDPDQMKAITSAYYDIAARHEVLIITFAHGWHHSAKPQDTNITSFRELLATVSRNEKQISEQQSRPARKVLGVYMAWRGDSLTIPVLKNLTFWDRKSVAHEVGQQGVTEALLRLEEIVNVKLGIADENPVTNSRLVVLGHSFGGALIYSSLQKILADRFIDSRKGQTFSGDAKGFGDLVVLVNPAFEALRFAALHDLSQTACRRYKVLKQVPRLAVLTSESDNATRLAFPAGRVFSTMFESHVTLDRHMCTQEGRKEVRIDEGKADRTAVGHFEPYLTHRLDPAPVMVRADLLQLITQWEEQSPDVPLNLNGSVLKSLDRTTPLNPYMNIQVDSTLIPNHNDIWGTAVQAFVADLILVSTTP